MTTPNCKKLTQEDLESLPMTKDTKIKINEFIETNVAYLCNGSFIYGDNSEIGKVCFLWCQLCSENKPLQDETGNYLLGKERVIMLADFEPVKNRTNFPQEIQLNFWFCPMCHRHLKELTPNFKFMDYYGDINNVSV